VNVSMLVQSTFRLNLKVHRSPKSQYNATQTVNMNISYMSYNITLTSSARCGPCSSMSLSLFTSCSIALDDAMSLSIADDNATVHNDIRKDNCSYMSQSVTIQAHAVVTNLQ